MQILYEGKTAESAMTRKAEFDTRVEEHAAEYVTSQLRKTENIATLAHMANPVTWATTCLPPFPMPPVWPLPEPLSLWCKIGSRPPNGLAIANYACAMT